MSAINHYEILEIPKTATEEEIRSAYRRLMRMQHPDRFSPGSEKWLQANMRTQVINVAYNTLKDTQKREEYDYLYFKQREPSPRQQDNRTHTTEADKLAEWSEDWRTMQSNVLRRCRNYDNRVWLSKALDAYKSGESFTKEDWLKCRDETLQFKVKLDEYMQKVMDQRAEFERNNRDSKSTRRAIANFQKQSKLEGPGFVYGAVALFLVAWGVVAQIAILILQQNNSNFQIAAFSFMAEITGPMYQSYLTSIRFGVCSCILLSYLTSRKINRATGWSILWLILSFAISFMSATYFAPLPPLFQ